MRWQQSRQFKHHAHGHRQVAVTKLRHACERIRSERGKWEGRKTRIGRAERENKSELVKAHTEVVEMAKQLRRASPKTGERGRYARSAPSSLRAGYLNERWRSQSPQH